MRFPLRRLRRAWEFTMYVRARLMLAYDRWGHAVAVLDDLRGTLARRQWSRAWK